MESVYKQLQYYLEVCTKLVADFAHRTTIDKVGFIIPNHLLNGVNPIATFCLHGETIASISIDRSNINKSVLAIEKSLIKYFVEFDNYMFYITSVDVFYTTMLILVIVPMVWSHVIIRPNLMP